MALQIRRGLNSERITKVLQNGEIAWTTDTKKLYIGDGVTTGGTNILQSAQGVGLSWNPVTEQLDLTASTLFINSSNVTETTNLFHTAQRAQDAAAALFTNASGDHVGISFVYDSVNHKLTATVAQENIEDKVGAVLVAGNATNTGITFTYDATADSNNRVNAAVDIEYLQDQVAAFFAAGVHSGITFTYEDNNNRLNATVTSADELIDDTSPQLGGNLDLNNFNISGTGNISIGGAITLTGKIIQNAYSAISLRDAYGITIGSYGSSEIFRVSRGTQASPATVQNGDVLHSNLTYAHNGTGYAPVSGIVTVVDNHVPIAGSAIPGALALIPIADGTGADTSKGVYIDSKGHMGILTNYAQLKATLDVNGFAKLAVLTAAPTTPANGMIAIADGTLWDPAGTGKSVMVVYLGGGWRVAATAP